MLMELQWTVKSFEELTTNELYKILQLRTEVFLLEQHCMVTDVDDNDQKAWHLCAWRDEELVAYSRLFAPGIIYREASIGRVVTRKDFRGSGIGKELIKRGIIAIYQLFGKTPVKIGAQLYLKKFYEEFGFSQNSGIYLEDKIEHIKMILP